MAAKWVTIYIAHGEKSADDAMALLAREGFLCRANSAGDSCYELMTLPTEAQEARDLLHENGF